LLSQINTVGLLFTAPALCCTVGIVRHYWEFVAASPELAMLYFVPGSYLAYIFLRSALGLLWTHRVRTAPEFAPAVKTTRQSIPQGYYDSWQAQYVSAFNTDLLQHEASGHDYLGRKQATQSTARD